MNRCRFSTAACHTSLIGAVVLSPCNFLHRHSTRRVMLTDHDTSYESIKYTKVTNLKDLATSKISPVATVMHYAARSRSLARAPLTKFLLYYMYVVVSRYALLVRRFHSDTYLNCLSLCEYKCSRDERINCRGRLPSVVVVVVAAGGSLRSKLCATGRRQKQQQQQ